MAVGNGHADALGCDGDVVAVDDPVALDMAPDLQRLLFALFLLAADIWDDVVDHLGPALKGLSGAGDSLICAGEDLVDLILLFERMDGGYVALERAIRLDRDEAALCAEAFLLSLDDLSVVGVDLGDYHGNVRCAAVGGVVGDNGALGLCVSFFKSFYLVLLHIYGAEHEVDL